MLEAIIGSAMRMTKHIIFDVGETAPRDRNDDDSDDDDGTKMK